jgi:hypothetical protein
MRKEGEERRGEERVLMKSVLANIIETRSVLSA